MTSPQRLRAALDYVQAGWRLLPLDGKDPYFALLPQDEHGKARTRLLMETPATEADVRQWFEYDPHVNLGALLHPGFPLIVDLDPNKRDGDGQWKLDDERRQELLNCDGFESTPLRVRSGSGGWHLYYRHPPSSIRVVGSKSHTKGDGIDVLSSRGRAYVVLPPSIHPGTGKPYAWIDADGQELRPCDAVALAHSKLPRWPKWTEEDARRAAMLRGDDSDSDRYAKGPKQWWLTEALTSPRPEGGTGDDGTGRNATLRRLALYFAARNIPADVSRAILWKWNQEYCQPPLKEEEVTRQVYVMYAHHKEDEIAKAKDRGELGDQVVLRQAGPSFPMHALECVPVISDWIHAMRVERGISTDLAAAAALGGLSFAAVGKYRCRWMRGRRLSDSPESAVWSFPATNWHIMIAPSGARKSIVSSAILDSLTPASDIIAKVARKFNVALSIHSESLHNAKKRALKELDRMPGSEILREHYARICRMIADLPPEMPTSWVSSDSTPEALLRQLAGSRFVGLYSSEGDELFSRVLGHYSDKADINGLLKTWSGEDIDVQRISRETLRIRGGVTSIFAFGQASVLYGLDEAGDAKDRGLHARILYAIPSCEVTAPSDDLEALEAARKAQRRYEAVLRAVFWGGIDAANEASRYAHTVHFKPVEVADEHVPPDIEPEEPKGRGRPRKPFVPPPATRLEPPQLREPVDVMIHGESLELLDTFGSRMRKHGEPGEDDWAISDWLSKAHEHAARLAVLLQIASQALASRDDTSALVLQPEFTEAAILIMEEYYLPHQRVARDIMARPKETDACIHALIRFTEKEEREQFTLSELSKAVGQPTQKTKKLARWMRDVGAVLIDDQSRNWILTPLPGIVY